MYVSRSEIESTYPLFTKQTLRLQIDASENTQTTPIIFRQDYTSRERSGHVVHTLFLQSKHNDCKSARAKTHKQTPLFVNKTTPRASGVVML